MKNLLLNFIFLTLLQIVGSAQNDLVVFSEDGHAFTLHVNGVKQNDTPAAQVKAEGIRNGSAALRVIFKDDIAPEIKKNWSFMEENTEVTVKISMTKKGYKLRYFGEAPVGTTPMPIEEETVVETASPAISSSPSSNSTTIVKETISTTTQESSNAGAENVNIGINVNGFNMGVNVNVDGDNVNMDMGSNTEVSTTTTTTTTTIKNEVPVQEVEYVEEVDSRCPSTMRDISHLKSMLDAESFSDNKMDIAKQALNNKCVEVSGIIDLSKSFDFESDRLEFLKFCYDRAINQGDFYMVNSVLEFSSSKEELNEYVLSKH